MTKLLTKLSLRDRNRVLSSNKILDSNGHFSVPLIDNRLCFHIANVVLRHCISYKTKNNFRTILTNTKHKINKLEKSSDYKLNYADCYAFYVARICRVFKTRVSK